jgi:hypothetical protein
MGAVAEGSGGRDRTENGHDVGTGPGPCRGDAVIPGYRPMMGTFVAGSMPVHVAAAAITARVTGRFSDGALGRTS